MQIPPLGKNTTAILYRLESDRAIFIWNDVPDYYGTSYNSFMVVIYRAGDIVFCYKDIQWPIPPIANRKRGFIGIRPFLREIDYSTRGNYYFTNNQMW